MKKVTLETIGGGALRELFNAELERVMVNIRDVNTDPAQKRTITMTVEFKPGAKREDAEVKLKCKSSLAGILTVNTQIFMGMKDGKLVAVESDLKQGALFDKPGDAVKPLAPVTNFPTNNGGGAVGSNNTQAGGA